MRARCPTNVKSPHPIVMVDDRPAMHDAAALVLAGEFEIVGLPLRGYRLLATEPVSGRLGVANASLNFDGQVLDLQVLVRSLGEVRGGVLNSARDGFVPGAVVTVIFGAMCGVPHLSGQP